MIAFYCRTTAVVTPMLLATLLLVLMAVTATAQAERQPVARPLPIHPLEPTGHTLPMQRAAIHSYTPTQVPAESASLLMETLLGQSHTPPLFVTRSLSTHHSTIEPTQQTGCTVTTTEDDGPESLRWCLQYATEQTLIDFDPAIFTPLAPVRIKVLSPLPTVIADEVMIDASSAGVILDGSNLQTGAGIMISGTTGVTLRGLQILNFPVGIALVNGAHDTVIGGSPSIGAAPLGQGNLVSGNIIGIGINDAETTGNQVLGNRIGTDLSGTQAFGNWMGILIGMGATGNLIGGDIPEAGNLVSSNVESGVQIQDIGTTGNRVIGNIIGANATGTASLANQYYGVVIGFGASSNVIGGDSAGARNLISGNTHIGIRLQNTDTISNHISGNYIGTNMNGTLPLANGEFGILVDLGASANVIGGKTPGARNLISGNSQIGVLIQNIGTTNNHVAGNYIGTDAAGSMPLPNGNFGIFVAAGASENVIGGETPGARNLISGNGEAGITLQDTDTAHNQVLGNYIGTDSTGTSALGNAVIGIQISHGASDNVIGGEAPGARNLISGNGEMGVVLIDPGTVGNQIQGNYIGADVSGSKAIANGRSGIGIGYGASANVIGGETTGARNLISGNGIGGVEIASVNTTHNRVLGNIIGADVTGTAALANGQVGIIIQEGAKENQIGGETAGARNLISGNGDIGVMLEDTNTMSNSVLGNTIGTNAAGSVALANGLAGVLIGLGARGNVIGGETAEMRNLISGNGQIGVWIWGENTGGNQVVENYIGTDITGASALPNGVAGIVINGRASGNTVGGEQPGARNLISGNGEFGVVLEGAGTTGNRILGNYVGTNSAGTAALGNQIAGVILTLGASGNIIGEEKPEAGNLISGNGQIGVGLEDPGTNGNRVAGNRIGTAITDTIPLPNLMYGVTLLAGASENIIGISNTIAFNGAAGVGISGTTTLGNTITRNTIHRNGAIPIAQLAPSPLPGPTASPSLIRYLPEMHTLIGRACSGCQVEVYANPMPEPAASIYLGQVIVMAGGDFTFTLPGPPPHPYLAAVQTDPDGTTTEFSAGLDTTVFNNNLYLPLTVR